MQSPAPGCTAAAMYAWRSGVASDNMSFCVDYGEAVYSFCVNVPVHSMIAYSVTGLRDGDAPIGKTV
jgi:hypothetical protein